MCCIISCFSHNSWVGPLYSSLTQLSSMAFTNFLVFLFLMIETGRFLLRRWNSCCLYVKVSLGKILNPQISLTSPSKFACMCKNVLSGALHKIYMIFSLLIMSYLTWEGNSWINTSRNTQIKIPIKTEIKNKDGFMTYINLKKQFILCPFLVYRTDLPYT